ncbi:unnamed protein product, partial [Hapterophycus canaliculatus]
KVRAEQALLTELESEWLNQFWVQGRRHAALHPWWRGPMALVLATWRELERRTASTVQSLMSLRDEEERRESRSRWGARDASGGGGVGSPLPRSLVGVISRLRECYTVVYRAASGGKKAGSAKAIAAGAASNWELFRAASARPSPGGGKANGAPRKQQERNEGRPATARKGGHGAKKSPAGRVGGGKTEGGSGGGRRRKDNGVFK